MECIAELSVMCLVHGVFSPRPVGNNPWIVDVCLKHTIVMLLIEGSAPQMSVFND